MVPVASRRVSRAPRYSGIRFESGPFLPTWLSHSVAPLSRGLRLTAGLVTLLLRTLQPLPHLKGNQVSMNRFFLSRSSFARAKISRARSHAAGTPALDCL